MENVTFLTPDAAQVKTEDVEKVELPRVRAAGEE
jgi:hypothetical protein